MAPETTTASEKLVFQVVINGRIEDVWREITRTDAPQQCFFNAMMHTTGLRPGGKVQMRTKSGRYTLVFGDVLEFDPPRKYALTFRFTQYDDPPCKVIHELREVAGGVEYTLTVEDVKAGSKTAKDMTGGGKMIVDTLKRIVETGRPSLGTRLMYRMFGLMEFVLPKKCKSENWPL